ncbi:hypothetical protein BTA51_11015 [Hahella sp. CCB-MM4]|uniref:hypothetical protein n=1 Tax=Hahella sp. (strain CCB-MM4) TaxID=1926491 RepID=UPI000B9C2DFB|nr:hypothetical protein [Hahella sp. CCB-MM4]OZG73533.1 hypothetical protein BTA51_11015 [Hahella sp. CCB-MM4]
MFPVVISKRCIAGLLLLLASIGAHAEEDPPTRANDLAYGEVLYSFYQQDYFQALTELALAETRGGIKGHGEHPMILKGGMMLSYGMVGPARKIFVDLLTEGNGEAGGAGAGEEEAVEEGAVGEERPKAVHVGPKVRMQAWFYLAKVHYLNRDWEHALEALEQIDVELLEDEWEERFEEYYYLKAQTLIGLNRLEELDHVLEEMADEVDDPSLLLSYLLFNKSLAMLANKQPEGALQTLEQMTFDDFDGALEDEAEEGGSSLKKEILALQDRVALTKAALYLDQGNSDMAMSSYRQIRLNGPWSERALFGFALAAANGKQFGLALGALKQLNDMQTDSLWVRESHYAIAYIYEQLGQEGRALKAYQNAVDAYGQSNVSLNSEIRSLNEDYFAGKMSLPETGRKVAIDDPELSTDSYGRLKVEPAAANLATLFASEAFLSILKDIRELTFLKNDLEKWQTSVNSFGIMVETRNQARNERVEATAASLAEKQSMALQERRDRLANLVEKGLEDDAGGMFINEEQLEFRDLIQQVKDRIAKLGNDPDIDEYREKLRRIEGYYLWQISETSTTQAWNTRKALKELDDELQSYNSRRDKLLSMMADTTVIGRLQQRVDAVRPRIAGLIARVDKALIDRKDKAVDMARKELSGQQDRIQTYLNASKLARARIADKLLEESLAPASEIAPPEKKEALQDQQGAAADKNESASAGTEEAES